MYPFGGLRTYYIPYVIPAHFPRGQAHQVISLSVKVDWLALTGEGKYEMCILQFVLDLLRLDALQISNCTYQGLPAHHMSKAVETTVVIAFLER